MSTTTFPVLSASTIRLSQPLPRCRCDLTPWDLFLLSDGYIQRGLLYPKPPTSFDAVVERLKDSLSHCLLHFYPLAGRLATDRETTVFIDCNDAGAQFVVAVCDGMSVSDLTSDGDVPVAVSSFFPFNGAINHDGHSLPLLAVQVTQLADGVFIGCSFNHTLGDGESFWHFMNSWSELSRGNQRISRPPILKRSFLNQQPIHFIPSEEALAKNKWPENLTERIFRFSRKSMARLKAEANRQCKMEKGAEISSLQALAALIWRAVTRARTAPAQQITTCWIVTGERHRLNPPLAREYFGNCTNSVGARSHAGELLSQEMGSVARVLHEKIAGRTAEAARSYLDAWLREPYLLSLDYHDPYCILILSSPRFEMYGNDFGWGRPVGVFSGSAAKLDGKIFASQGSEGSRSIDLEVCLSPQAMSALVLDEELMEALASN